VAALLSTPRLVLSPAREEDLDPLHALWTEPSVRRFLFDDRVLAAAEARAHLAESAASFAERGFGVWLVREVGSPEPTGFAGLLGAGGREPSLIYGVHPGRCGRGLATEAGRAVLEHAFGVLRVPRVVADVDEPNVASVRVLEKLGMRRVGRGVVRGRPLLYFECSRGPR
jgi:RimJ/RimL family protein N-acetyltransferase